MKDSRAGFTLIELLVVIGILALLVTAFAPDIIGMMSRGNQAADKANQRWHHVQLMSYHQKFKRYGKRDGHGFVLGPWVEGIVERTSQNMQRYFTPGVLDTDTYYQELRERDPTELWRDYDQLTSEDTHYAGAILKAQRKHKFLSGHTPWLANDNEFGPAFRDNTIHVLMGDGNVKEILEQELIAEYGFDPDGGEVFEVGPGSPHPLLQQLEK